MPKKLTTNLSSSDRDILINLAELVLKSLQDLMKSNVESFGQNRLKIVAGNEKSRPWSNQDAEENI